MNLSKLTKISELQELEKMWQARFKMLYDFFIDRPLHDPKRVKAVRLYTKMLGRLSTLREINRKIDLKELFY